MKPYPTPLAGLTALAGLSALALSLACSGTTDKTAAALPWPEPPTSVGYAARTGQVLPAAVASATGVTDSANATSGGSFTLTYPTGGTAPSIVLDYGRIVGGNPQFQVVSATGAPRWLQTFRNARATPSLPRVISTGLPHISIAL